MCVRKTKYINITSSLIVLPTLSFCSLTTVRSSASPIPTVSKMCVRTGGSEFAWKTAHSSVKFVFYKSQPLLGKWRAHISAPFCAYASFIKETSGTNMKM